MTHKVLHILSQRPSLTGSGVTLDALVRHALSSNWEQRVIVGTPKDDPHPSVGGLPSVHIHPLRFETDALPFPVPGMSDVMPYKSTVFSTMRPEQIEAYLAAWREHVQHVIKSFQPDIIHSHHVWLLSSILKELAPDIPVVTHCHATGLRQMTLCPTLSDRVTQGCSRNDFFFTLRKDHSTELQKAIGIKPENVHVVGAGYCDEIFSTHDTTENRRDQILYTGKYARAKGLHCLLDAVDTMVAEGRNLTLHVAGSGAGPESDSLKDRMERPRHIVLHGQLPQDDLAKLMRKCSVCVLPSFYEGVPLVLVEAIACGCRVLSTDLQGVIDVLEPALSFALDVVPMPTLCGVDTPVESELPAFVERLVDGLTAALEKAPVNTSNPVFLKSLELFTWRSVFERVQEVWNKTR